MLGLLRREKRPQATGLGHTDIQADLSNAMVHGPVAIGQNIVQIHAEHGAIVNYQAPEQRMVPELREPPVLRLPRDFPELLGREQELAAIRSGLKAALPVELHGATGVGKSALLRHIAHRPNEAGRTGVIYTACARTPADDLLQFLFESLYMCERPLVPSPAELAHYLAEPRPLVLLDDVEFTRQELERVLGLAHSATFVTASPQRRVWGEGRSLELAGLQEQAARALFERELGGETPRSYRQAVNEFCRSRPLPLRVLQAAELVRSGQLSVDALQQATFFGGEGLEQLLAASLSPAERSALDAFSVLPDRPLNAEQVATLSGEPDTEALLAGLEQRGLVQSHSPRYTLRTFSPEGLRSDVDRQTAGQASQPGDGWSLTLARQLTIWCQAQETAEPVAEVAPAILAVLERSATARRHADVLKLARASEKYLMAGRRWGAWEVALNFDLQAARALEDRAEEAYALNQLGARHLARGEEEAALSALVRALELRDALGDSEGAAVTRHNLGLLGGPPARDSRGWRPPRPPLAGLLGLGLATLLGIGALVSQIGDAEQGTQPGVGTSEEPGQSRDGPEQNRSSEQPSPERPSDPEAEKQADARFDENEPSNAEQPRRREAVSLPENLDFGDQPFDNRSEPRAVRAVNRGPVSIRLGRVSLESNDFEVVADGCSDVGLEPAESCEIRIVFFAATPAQDASPLLFGEGIMRRAELIFENTGTGRPGRVVLTGRAVPAPSEPVEPLDGAPQVPPPLVRPPD